MVEAEDDYAGGLYGDDLVEYVNKLKAKA